MNRWTSAAGGIQTVNRELACALADFYADVECIVIVTYANPDEHIHAKSRGVKLIAGNAEDDWSSAVLSPELIDIRPKSVIAIIGHSYFSGSHALLLRRRFFPSALSVHFIHMSPLDTEALKEYRKDAYVVEREERVRREMEIAERADMVVCIGQRLWRYARDLLQARGYAGAGGVQFMYCGLDTSRNERTNRPLHPTLLCLGRTEA